MKGGISMYPFRNYLLYVIVLGFTLLLLSAEQRKAILSPATSALRQIGWGIGLGLGLLILVGAINVLFFHSFSVFFFAACPAKVIVNFLTFQILVAVTEELLFRGYFTELGRQWKLNDLLIALLSALLFGALHWLFNRDLIQFIMATAIGLLFSLFYIKEKSCSIYSLMIAHFLYDIAIVDP